MPKSTSTPSSPKRAYFQLRAQELGLKQRQQRAFVLAAQRVYETQMAKLRQERQRLYELKQRLIAENAPERAVDDVKTDEFINALEEYVADDAAIEIAARRMQAEGTIPVVAL
jgi:hypothetical protein